MWEARRRRGPSIKSQAPSPPNDSAVQRRRTAPLQARSDGAPPDQRSRFRWWLPRWSIEVPAARAIVESRQDMLHPWGGAVSRKLGGANERCGGRFIGGGPQRSAANFTFEDGHHVCGPVAVRVDNHTGRPAVHTKKPDGVDVEAGLFPHFANDCVRWSLGRVTRSARGAPNSARGLPH